VQEMREQKGAATAIQARYRQRAAQREVNALRKEKQETDQAATRIQSRFRQRQANGEVEAMRRRRLEADRNRRREEFHRHFAVKIEISKETSSAASVKISVVPKEVVDIPANEETAQAATKIQARFRQKQAASEVDAMRKGKDEQAAPATDPADEIPDNEETAQAATKIQARFRQKQATSEVDAMRKGKDEQAAPATDPADEIPDNEETAQAATKIQAKFRQKQAASEVESLKKEKEETAQAATKIQAKFRQKQAKNEVDAMRANASGGDGTGPAETTAEMTTETSPPEDDEIKAEDMKTTSEFGAVEAMLAKKQKEQQDLVNDKSPKVEGMVPAAAEKRPMSVSPVIMEGDEEE